MARGFESKDVEFQQAEAERAAPSGPPLTAAERDRQTRRKTLELALANVRATRRTARSPAHQRMLDEAAAALERDLAALQ
ncbi:MAG TPA: hypothetical protein VH583_08880 [Vicinamibacterales bacterium]|jgi:hypothetical protein